MADKQGKTRRIMVGSVPVGGGAPVSVQSMCNTDSRDAAATAAQIKALAAAGCEIVRCAVPDLEAVTALREICAASPIPVIADIHFDYRLALGAARSGVAGLRLNPGNIGERWKVAEVVKACAERSLPIRIGVNAGSLEPELLQRYGHATPEAIVESALRHARLLEELHFEAIKISVKASDIRRTVAAYRLLGAQTDYPLHLGITEAGTVWAGTIKSAIGIGMLLAEGIGDTIRVSLTGDPVTEVRVGWEILKALGLRQRGPIFISCPTCGRCRIDLIGVAEEVEARLRDLKAPLVIAVMGCSVNGPGEAREADVGIAGGIGEGLLFCKGEILRKVPEARLVEELVAEALRLAEQAS
ncbi:MAG: flavodoxin-dependent (E)-4-hydroxy-3-methylbut-2-enyl-diphosphate synthase [Deltaproteobacteria bacterium]|nr:flavodoxin-dependent (E)-4-hydroxy-3-methylbut-2-enyl-diphosphate synthase [Deltaproteobacteria bacterium]